MYGAWFIWQCELLSSLGGNHLCLRFMESSKMLSIIPNSCPRGPLEPSSDWERPVRLAREMLLIIDSRNLIKTFIVPFIFSPISCNKSSQARTPYISIYRERDAHTPKQRRGREFKDRTTYQPYITRQQLLF